MDNVLEKLGYKIKIYRKQRGLNLSQFSKLIHKSEPTISKYENGKISIDFLTLMDIAKALKVNVHDLLDFPIEDSTNQIDSKHNNPFFDYKTLYLYYYDGRVKSIIKSVIKFFYSETRGCEATLFVDIQSFDKYEKCKYIYNGTVEFFDVVTHFRLRNNVTPLETLNISVISPMEQFYCTTGVMNAMAYDSFNPLTLKVIISKKIISNTRDIENLLMINKDEIKDMKKNNMLCVSKTSR